MPHADWKSKKIPQTLNCAPIVTIIERHPRALLQLLSLGWEGRITATVGIRKLTANGAISVVRDWELDLLDWEILSQKRNMSELLDGRRVTGVFDGQEVELSGPVFFDRDGILDLIDQLEPAPDRNGIRNSATFKWEDWDAYQPEEHREYAEFPSEFAGVATVDHAGPQTESPLPRAASAGAKPNSQGWQDLCLVLVEMALHGKLDQKVHLNQAALRNTILDDERVRFSDETIKGLVRRLWNGPMDPGQ